MKLIVGLGNHGAKYAGNRHNIGYMVVDAIHDHHRFSPWRKRFRGQTADGTLGGEKVLLLKPETFMNESGRSVSEAARFLKIKPADTIVLHDELDLAPGKVRAKIGGGHAGHNGLRSIIAQFDKEFVRIRLGIGHPGHKDRVAGYVLHDFAKADAQWLEPLVETLAREAALLASSDVTKLQTALGQALADVDAPGNLDGRGANPRGARQHSAGSSNTTGSGRPGASGRPSAAGRAGSGTGGLKRTSNRKTPSQAELARKAAANRSSNNNATRNASRPPDGTSSGPENTGSTTSEPKLSGRENSKPNTSGPEVKNTGEAGKNALAERLKSWFSSGKS